eukprot:1153841-Pelagomonas_calceolata.AAC.2
MPAGIDVAAPPPSVPLLRVQASKLAHSVKASKPACTFWVLARQSTWQKRFAAKQRSFLCSVQPSNDFAFMLPGVGGPKAFQATVPHAPSLIWIVNVVLQQDVLGITRDLMRVDNHAHTAPSRGIYGLQREMNDMMPVLAATAKIILQAYRHKPASSTLKSLVRSQKRPGAAATWGKKVHGV